jgi:hypothetical protein
MCVCALTPSGVLVPHLRQGGNGLIAQIVRTIHRAQHKQADPYELLFDSEKRRIGGFLTVNIVNMNNNDKVRGGAGIAPTISGFPLWRQARPSFQPALRFC